MKSECLFQTSSVVNDSMVINTPELIAVVLLSLVNCKHIAEYFGVRDGRLSPDYLCFKIDLFMGEEVGIMK